ncbi:MAG: hypothetical protein ABFS28_05385 [Bacteroidota bacterium]
MKYRIIIITVLLGFLASCEKEISPKQAEKFMKFYGNYLIDQASDVDILDNGGFAICGTDSTAEYGKRMVLIVTDSYGNIENGFPKYFTKEDSDSGGSLESGANAIEAIRGGLGGYMLFGYVENYNADNTGFQKDGFVVKASTHGDEIWQRTYGSEEDEVILHATQRFSSGYMLAGYQVQDGKSDILVFGIKEEGDSIPLSLFYNNPYATNSTANYLLSYRDRYLCVCTYDKIGDNGTDLLILTFNDELSPNLGEYLTGDVDEFGMCVIEDGPDRFLVLGNRHNTQSGRKEMVIYLIETEGEYITKSLQLATISQSNTDLIGRRFVKTDDGRYVIVGSRTVYGSSDIFLQFLSSDYAVTGNVVFGASGTQTGADIDIADDGGIVVLGTNGSHKSSMISLIKTSDRGDL